MDSAIANVSIAAGAVRTPSPCVLLPMSGYMSPTAGDRATRPGKLRIATLGPCSVFRSATNIVALGTNAMPLDRPRRFWPVKADIVGGELALSPGVVTTGPVRMPWMDRDVRHADGVALLSRYSPGFRIPFVVARVFTYGLRGVPKEMRGAGRALEVGSGLVMVAMGLAVAGTASWFAFRPPARLPVLGRIG